jgi:hypothetical protein
MNQSAGLNVIESVIFTDGAQPAVDTQPDTHPADRHSNQFSVGAISATSVGDKCYTYRRKKLPGGGRCVVADFAEEGAALKLVDDAGPVVVLLPKRHFQVLDTS